jgi:hypothetical protein
MFRNKQQNSQLHKLISRLGIDAEGKEELVFKFTNGRENSSAKMLVHECQNLINYLNAQVKTAPTQKQNTPENQMRRKVLSVCHEMGWKKGDKVDFGRLDAFMLKSSILKKPLNDYKVDELPQLVTQFEQLLKSFYAAR